MEGLQYKGDPACARTSVAHGQPGKCVCTALLLEQQLRKIVQCAEAEHGLCAVGLQELRFKATDSLFAVKMFSLLQRMCFDSLSAFVLEGSVVPNLTSGVIELPTVLQTWL